MEHRVFKFISDKYHKVIVWIPTLSKLYAADICRYDEIPSFVEDNKEDNEKEVNSRYQFVGVTLFLTTKCNLQCSYCYEGASHFKGKEMPEEIAYAAVNYILDYARRTTKISRLSFFGGEPTVAWSLLVKITDY